MTLTELAALLTECYGERLALLQRHVASAAHISDYDVNNAYQYIIAREETHVYWLHRAILDTGGKVPAAPPAPTVAVAGIRELAGADARAVADFVARWQPRVATVTHARHRKMLEVMLGEMREQQRLFEQAAEGRTDLIGRPMAGVERQGAVLATRWVE